MQNPLPEQVTFDGLLFPGRRMLNVAEIAERLLISQRHVVDLIDEGKLRALNISGDKRRHYRIPVEAYEAFIKSRTL
jgi:excisionase family DNA binding protein